MITDLLLSIFTRVTSTKSYLWKSPCTRQEDVRPPAIHIYKSNIYKVLIVKEPLQQAGGCESSTVIHQFAAGSEDVTRWNRRPPLTHNIRPPTTNNSSDIDSTDVTLARSDYQETWDLDINKKGHLNKSFSIVHLPTTCEHVFAGLTSRK